MVLGAGAEQKEWANSDDTKRTENFFTQINQRLEKSKEECKGAYTFYDQQLKDSYSAGPSRPAP